jgi:SAM-dependent methyltransferase
MTFYRDRIYPRLVKGLGDPQPIRRLRQQMVRQAQGTVLEVGVGPGVNFAHYDPARATKILALEPNPGMVRLARKERHRTPIDVEFLDLPGERLPLGDATVDTVLSTFTMCSIPGVSAAIREMRRVLKPGGRLVFIEHGLSPDRRIQRWQRWSEPIPHWLFEGCHITRDIPGLLGEGGFRIAGMEAGYLAAFPKSWTYTWWGSAVGEGPTS